MRSSRFHRKFSRPLIGILLLTLVLRAWIPVGFMPVMEADGSLTFALCPGAAPTVPVAGDPHAHHGHHQPSGPDAASEEESDDAPFTGHNVPCLFAASATSAPAPELAEVRRAAVQVLQARSVEAAPRFTPAILRAQSARAPPSLI